LCELSRLELSKHTAARQQPQHPIQLSGVRPRVARKLLV
jgi:hypothetical protein